MCDLSCETEGIRIVLEERVQPLLILFGLQYLVFNLFITVPYKSQGYTGFTSVAPVATVHFDLCVQ